MKKSPPWLNEEHPNFERWQKARAISEDRGRFVKLIISKFIECRHLNILELGSGEGGTACILSKDNYYISVDLSLLRLQRQPENILRINADALNLPFKQSEFDLIILQDVLEHIPDNKNFLNNLSSFLKSNGIIFLSTPNRFSLINLFADPHFGLPFISLLKRDKIKKYVLPVVRKEDAKRNDIAQLLSLKELFQMSENYEFKINTRSAVSELFNGNKGIIWSSFHIKLANLIQRTGLHRIILKIANDKASFLNNFFTPSFYLILKRK